MSSMYGLCPTCGDALNENEWLRGTVARLTAELEQARAGLHAIVAHDEKGPEWEPYDQFGDPNDIDESNHDDHRQHGRWQAHQEDARIARHALAARTLSPGDSTDGQ